LFDVSSSEYRNRIIPSESVRDRLKKTNVLGFTVLIMYPFVALQYPR
jgi:hypothetical protein